MSMGSSGLPGNTSSPPGGEDFFFTLHNILFTIKYSEVVLNVNLNLVAYVRYVYGVKWSVY